MPNPRLLPILLAALVSAIGCAAAATDPPKATPAAAGVSAPIEFYLARGDADACGPGCNDWIAAEGKIDAGAAQRLRQLLAKLGRARPPIYFHSPGGLVVGALELGRLIRGQKLQVSVAHTIATGCNADSPPEKSCEAQKRSAQGLAAKFDLTTAMCNSACVYALAGGAVRQVPPWVKLGVHDVGIDPAKTPPRGAAAGRGKAVAHEHILEYLHEMGFDDALYKAAIAVPFESARFLEREELVRFGIDRREFGDTSWQFIDKPAAGVIKRFFARTDNDSVRYFDGFVMLSCGAGQTIRLALARGRGVAEISGTGSRPISISLNGQRVDLRERTSSSELDLRWAWLPVGTLDALAGNATVGLSGTDLVRNDDSAAGMTLDMHGFAAEYAKLRKGCDQPIQAPTPMASPTNPIPYIGAKSLGMPSGQAVQGWPKDSAPPAPEPPRAQSVATAAAAPPQTEPPRDEPTQRDCERQLAAEPKQLTGRVTGFLSGRQALAITQRVEAQLGAKINPAYTSLERVNIELTLSGGSGFTLAAIPDGMTVKIGDLVEINSRYKDPSLPCHFIPWMVNRLVDHVE
jgi:hypothetical protein